MLGAHADPDEPGRQAAEESEAEGEMDRHGHPMKLIVGKQRNGPTGDIQVVFMRPYAKFANMAREQKE